MDLATDFERQLRESLLDDVETTLVGEANNLVFQAIQQSHERLREYADQYNVEPIIDSLGVVDVDRGERGITVRYGWQAEAAPYFAYGTSRHTIQGQPVLSFIWNDPPQWVTEEFEAEGDGYRVFFAEVEVEGIERTAFVQAGLRWLQRELST